MSSRVFTQNEIAALKMHPFVKSVTERKIFYKDEFKRRFIQEDLLHKKIGKIFHDAGFDVKMLGAKRIERAAARWRELYESGKLGDINKK